MKENAKVIRKPYFKKLMLSALCFLFFTAVQAQTVSGTVFSSFLNGYEAFGDFIRSGFPSLTPNPYGQPNNPDVPNGTFIRRLTYPTSEISVNTVNMNAAISRQGSDKLSPGIWWDK